MTQTLSKPAKAARTIVTLKTSHAGIRAEIAKTARDQITKAQEIYRAIGGIPQYAEAAKEAIAKADALLAMIDNPL